MTNQDIPGTELNSTGTQQDSPGTEEDSPEASQNQTPSEKSRAYNTTTGCPQDPS